jgi:hypothetical protein
METMVTLNVLPALYAQGSLDMGIGMMFPSFINGICILTEVWRVQDAQVLEDLAMLCEPMFLGHE